MHGFGEGLRQSWTEAGQYMFCRSDLMTARVSAADLALPVSRLETGDAAAERASREILITTLRERKGSGDFPRVPAKSFSLPCCFLEPLCAVTSDS